MIKKPTVELVKFAHLNHDIIIISQNKEKVLWNEKYHKIEMRRDNIGTHIVKCIYRNRLRFLKQEWSAKIFNGLEPGNLLLKGFFLRGGHLFQTVVMHKPFVIENIFLASEMVPFGWLV